MKKENNKKNDLVEISILDALLDPKNDDTITLTDDENNQFEFDQVAVVPHENEIYALLTPHDHIEGIGEDEAVVMKVYTNENGEEVLESIVDDKLLDVIFDKYYKMFDEAQGK